MWRSSQTSGNIWISYLNRTSKKENMGTRRTTMGFKQQGLWSMCTFLVLFVVASVSATEAEHFIVQLSRHRRGKDGALSSHRGYLEAVLGSPEKVEQSLIYRFNNVFDGFAAKLTMEQVTKLSKMEGVLSVVPNTMVEPATTNSWNFLGVESSTLPNSGALWERAKYGEDLIVGVVDTGIWPESPSFSDEGLGPIPARWKGKCVEGQRFTTANCNKKLIGARWYYAGNSKVNFKQEYNSSRDNQGHGTHVASTAAGAFAPASYFGYASGTAKGGAPRARLAIYKVCWYNANCTHADIVKAIEDAITDGVDLMCISISGSNDRPFYSDVVGIASFAAMRTGILVNFAAGNSGPGIRTVNHVEPWSFTVASATQDRFLGADVTIKSNGSPQPGLQFRGGTASDFNALVAPMILASEAARGDKDTASFCVAGTLDPVKVKGKIVFCLKGQSNEFISSKSVTVKNAGGVGMIAGNTRELEDYTIEATRLLIPAVHVTPDDAQRIVDYFTKCGLEECTVRTATATATIGKGDTFLGLKPAPVIARTSGHGPSGVTTDILKPDIAAPGVNILAAGINGNNEYTLKSGTSMAAPHISGVVALVKAVHPDWSPAAIKSAIMTTANRLDNTGALIKNHQNKPAGAFSTGSGLVNPVAAVDPGLVYDADWSDYTLFLCSLKYTDAQIETITGEKGFCRGKAIPSPSDLNYPSVSIGDLAQPTEITRRVTNVGKANSEYSVVVESPRGVIVTISPSRLIFSSAQKTKSFSIHLKRSEPVDSQESYVFGSFTWSDGVHEVSSPIVVGSKPRYSYEGGDGLIMSY